MNVSAALCQSTIKTQLWSIPMCSGDKGAVCSFPDREGRPSRKWGIRHPGTLAGGSFIRSFIHEAFLGQFWADAGDAKVN